MLATLVLLSACTTPVVRDTSSIDALTVQCETEACVVALMDTLPQGPDEGRYPFMEGVSDTNLTDLLAKGRLDVQPINPLWLLSITYGYALVYTKPYGGVSRCTVRYLPGLNWLALKHELSHCQGYEDHGLPLQIADYTEEQRKIMDKEGATRWVDTRMYQSGLTR
ncbi:MAG: hypothetical protein KAX46_03120 [Chromatiaceae bacterium]|nr:hypothetical protein [Chromatiaceae bacterium]